MVLSHFNYFARIKKIIKQQFINCFYPLIKYYLMNEVDARVRAKLKIKPEITVH